jgi:hypothetical protein
MKVGAERTKAISLRGHEVGTPPAWCVSQIANQAVVTFPYQFCWTAYGESAVLIRLDN